jgi:hypothetical protein
VAGALLFAVLYLLAAYLYPGGSEFTPDATAFSWTENYWCNLLNNTAINGRVNVGRPYALIAMIVLALTLTSFWHLSALRLSTSRKSRPLIQVSGTLSMLILILLSSSYHDVVINLASVFGLIAFLKTMAELKRRKLTRLWCFGVFNLALVATNNILYYNTTWRLYLPVVQKVTFLTFLGWVCLVCWVMFRYLKRSTLPLLPEVEQPLTAASRNAG